VHTGSRSSDLCPRKKDFWRNDRSPPMQVRAICFQATGNSSGTDRHLEMQCSGFGRADRVQRVRYSEGAVQELGDWDRNDCPVRTQSSL
jgi:hypothetical protein